MLDQCQDNFFGGAARFRAGRGYKCGLNMQLPGGNMLDQECQDNFFGGAAHLLILLVGNGRKNMTSLL